MLKLNRVVAEIAQAIESLALRVNAHDLVAGRFAGGRDDTHSWSQVTIAIHQFEQTKFVQYAEGVAIGGIGVPESLLCFGFIPVCSSKIDARIWEAWHVGPAASCGSTDVVIEVRVSNNKMSNIFRMNTLCE